MKCGTGIFYKTFYRQRDFRGERLGDSHTVPKDVNEFVPVLFAFLDLCVPKFGIGYLAFCDRLLAGIAGSNPTGCMDVSFECCVMSGVGLCVGLIIRPEESCRV
jgi:hypothetical protein